MTLFGNGVFADVISLDEGARMDPKFIYEDESRGQNEIQRRR